MEDSKKPKSKKCASKIRRAVQELIHAELDKICPKQKEMA